MTASAAITTPPSARQAEIEGHVLVRAQHGEEYACRTLVETYQRPMHALVWRMLGSAGRRQLAEDLLQEAFLRAFGALPRFVPEGPARLSTWLLSIAARTVIDELRRSRSRSGMRVTPLEDHVAPAPNADRPDWHGERASLGRAIAHAVDTLGPEVRATFVLRAYHGLSYPEVAQALDVDIGTVKSRLHRARRALQTELVEVRNE